MGDTPIDLRILARCMGQLRYMFLMTDSDLRVDDSGAGWVLSGPAAPRFTLVNEFLGYLATGGTRRRPCGPTRSTCWRSAAGWLAEDAQLGGRDGRDAAAVPVALPHRDVPRAAGRERVLDPRRPQHRVCGGDRQPADGRDLGDVRVPGDARSRTRPARCPRARPAGRRAAPSASGLLGHLAAPRPASKLRVRQPRRLPKGLDADQATALLDSFRSWRDKAIAGLMLLSGLRSAEVLALNVSDVDIPRGWVLVTGKGDKERRVPVDAEVAGLIQTYLLLERPGRRRGRHGHRTGCSSWPRDRTGDARSPPRGCGPCSGITGNGRA